jgi:hypothetical protein
MLTKQPNRPFCENCKICLAKPNGVSKHGFKKWHKYCSSCCKTIYNPKFNYLQNKKNICELCNFQAEDKCQLDLVYLDNNKKNKAENNLKTMCANCSRLYHKRLKSDPNTILNITIDCDVRI